MQAFRVEWRVSQRAKWGVLVLHVAAIVGCVCWFDGIAGWLGLLLLLASAYWAWQQYDLAGKTAIRVLEVDEHGYAAVWLAQEQGLLDADLLGGSLVHRHMCFLAWRIGECTVWQFVLPDMTDKESYRRLMVWARYGRPRQ